MKLKEKRIDVKLTPAQYDEIKAAADSVGTGSIAGYIRMAAIAKARKDNSNE